MPTLSTYVSDEVAEAIKAHADNYYRGKISAYLADIIDSHLKNQKESPMTKSERERLEFVESQLQALNQAVEQLLKEVSSKPNKPAP